MELPKFVKTSTPKKKNYDDDVLNSMKRWFARPKTCSMWSKIYYFGWRKTREILAISNKGRPMRKGKRAWKKDDP